MTYKLKDMTTANPFLALSLIVERERQELEQQFREEANDVEEEEDEDDDQHDESAIFANLKALDWVAANKKGCGMVSTGNACANLWKRDKRSAMLNFWPAAQDKGAASLPLFPQPQQLLSLCPLLLCEFAFLVFLLDQHRFLVKAWFFLASWVVLLR